MPTHLRNDSDIEIQKIATQRCCHAFYTILLTVFKLKVAFLIRKNCPAITCSGDSLKSLSFQHRTAEIYTDGVLRGKKYGYPQ